MCRGRPLSTAGVLLLANIPNAITLGRVMSVPVLFYLLVSQRSVAAFIVFVLAGLSDAVDGYLAKRFDWRSELGAYLDPLADKLLIVSIFIALGVRNELPLWLVIAVVLCAVWAAPRLCTQPVHSGKRSAGPLRVFAAVVRADGALAGVLGACRGAVVGVVVVVGGVSVAALLRDRGRVPRRTPLHWG